jgi:hypothetical protein
MMDYILHNLFSTEAGVVWLVLKWALVVLAAGFIGQFGKAFATYLIRRAREGKQEETVPAAGHEARSPAVRQEAAPQAAGSSPAAGTAVAGDVEALQKEREKEQKKARKDRQKSAKKALKGIQKLFK